MEGLAGELEVERLRSLGRAHHAVVRRLSHDQVRGPEIRLGKRFRPPGSGFLAREQQQPEAGLSLFRQPLACRHHGKHLPLRVAGAPATDGQAVGRREIPSSGFALLGMTRRSTLLGMTRRTAILGRNACCHSERSEGICFAVMAGCNRPSVREGRRNIRRNGVEMAAEHDPGLAPGEEEVQGAVADLIDPQDGPVRLRKHPGERFGEPFGDFPLLAGSGIEAQKLFEEV